MSRERLSLCLDDVTGGPSLDTATSRAVLQRVDRGELPATLRLSRPPRVVAFGSRDTRAAGFPDAVRAATAAGFGSVLRLAGGRAAVFTASTIAFAWAVPTSTPAAAITERFATLSGALRDAFTSLGVDARIGEVAGEYCPGEWSVNVRGRRKVAGVGQRLLRNAAHTGGVVVVDDAAAVNRALSGVYAALAEAWDPAVTGQLVDEAAVSWEQVRDAIVAAFETRFEVERWHLDEPTLALARRLAPEHLPDGAPAA